MVVMQGGYLLAQRWMLSSEIKVVKRRVQNVGAVAVAKSTAVPQLIRSETRDRENWLRWIGDRLRIRERLQLLCEQAGLRTPIEAIIRRSIVWSMGAGSITLY